MRARREGRVLPGRRRAARGTGCPVELRPARPVRCVAQPLHARRWPACPVVHVVGPSGGFLSAGPRSLPVPLRAV